MNAPLRALIVDDEPLARRGLRLRLEALGGIEIVGESANGRAAVEDIVRERPDVVFLDVQMPGMDGFAVVDAVGAARMPVTVFVTAHDAHALRAFDAHAIDYLLKPVDDARLAAAIARVRALVGAGRMPQRLVLRDGARAIVMDAGEIDWIEADDDYVRVYVAGRSHLVRQTLGSLAESLDPARFLRIHRSTLVNADRIREVRPEGDRGFRVVLRDGTALRMSRGHRQALERVLASATTPRRS